MPRQISTSKTTRSQCLDLLIAINTSRSQCPVCTRERNKPERKMSWSLIGWKFRLNQLQLRARAKIFVRTKLSTNQRPGNHVSIYVLYLRKYFAPLYRRGPHSEMESWRPSIWTICSPLDLASLANSSWKCWETSPYCPATKQRRAPNPFSVSDNLCGAHRSLPY